MKWNHVDLNLKLWIIPGDETKNEEPMVVPLLDQAVEVLSRRKKGRISIFVFPSPRTSKTGHYTEPKKGWKNLLKRANLSPDCRLHDIRRTMGSWQAITGSSTKIIGASLGHKSEQATAHYAHLTIDPVRKSMERAAAAMNEARNAPDKVVKIRKN
jgi:integrase